MSDELDITIVTGLSGAGRSEAANVLEDLGFFVIDNLPPLLIPKVAELARAPGRPPTRYALGADIRSGALEDLHVALEQLRETIRAAAPRATEKISYAMPAFEQDGRFLVSYAAFKGHCSLYPASTAVMEALGAELQPYFSGKGTLRFRADDPIPTALVRKIVRVRLQENAARRASG